MINKALMPSPPIIFIFVSFIPSLVPRPVAELASVYFAKVKEPIFNFKFNFFDQRYTPVAALCKLSCSVCQSNHQVGGQVG